MRNYRGCERRPLLPDTSEHLNQNQSRSLGNRKGKYTKRLEKEKQSEREQRAQKIKDRASLEQSRLADVAAKSPPVAPAGTETVDSCCIQINLYSALYCVYELHCSAMKWTVLLFRP